MNSMVDEAIKKQLYVAEEDDDFDDEVAGRGPKTLLERLSKCTNS